MSPNVSSVVWRSLSLAALVAMAAACGDDNQMMNSTKDMAVASDLAGGDATVSCDGNLLACGGKCVDVLTDKANCGQCGKACAGTETCTAGQCVVPCTQGTTNCSGKCVNLQTDPTNCNACGMACPAPMNAMPTCAA